jgi:exonuclease 3'-5' domain-containing protein 1
MDPSTYETLRNQTLLFFIEKLLEKSPRSLHDLSCQFGSKHFTKEMRQIAGGGQSGLRKFLLQYPSLFSIEEESVSYATQVKQRVGRDYNKEAVEYFRSRLLQYGYNVRVPIRSLLGHRSQANIEIRHVSGQHINEFRSFLQRNSEFVLSEEFVWLKEFEHEKLTEFKEVNVNYDKEIVHKLCKFFVTLVVDKGPMLVEQLFHQVGVEFEAGEFEGIFKNPNDLAVFLRIQPQIFQVRYSFPILTTHL